MGIGAAPDIEQPTKNRASRSIIDLNDDGTLLIDEHPRNGKPAAIGSLEDDAANGVRIVWSCARFAIRSVSS